MPDLVAIRAEGRHGRVVDVVAEGVHRGRGVVGRRRHGEVASEGGLLLHAGHGGHGDLCHEGSEVEGGSGGAGGGSGGALGRGEASRRGGGDEASDVGLGEGRRVGSVEGRAGEVRLEGGNVVVERSA